jgi:hypothetical protein
MLHPMPKRHFRPGSETAMNRTPLRQGLAYTRIARALCTNAGMAAAGALIVIASHVPPAAVLPSLSIVYLTAAGLLALIGWGIGDDDRNSNKVTIWDLSGAFAFLGFAAGILSTPEDVMTVFSVGGG